jgi:pimeloyl-ACP methyl ester carboxylesterase
LASADAAPARECVILLHGLGRTAFSMLPMSRALQEAGYATVNIDYPSRRLPIETLAASALPRGLAQCHEAGSDTVHIVTHSMGGLLTRQFLSENQIPSLGRVVMMGPPNQGSAVADRLMAEAFYQRLNGPAGQQLGTGPDGIAARLGPVDFPLGVLAGNQRTPVDVYLSEGIDEPSDGKVTVEEAKVEGMADFRVLEANHTFILSDPEAIRQALHFLREGRFSDEDEGSDAEASGAAAPLD